MRAGAALAASTHIATRTTREARVRAAAERTVEKYFSWTDYALAPVQSRS
jgi:hypothetical protein